MVKILKFALEMRSGEKARTLEELIAFFDITKIIEHFISGRLQSWLKNRHYDDILEEISTLNTEDKNLAQKLCNAFGIEYDNSMVETDKVNINNIQKNHARIDTLRQYTSDVDIIAQIDYVAFDQDDLDKLAAGNNEKIYLLKGQYNIPLNFNNKHYIGISKCEVLIESDNWIDFEDKKIKFSNITFNNKYQKIIESEELIKKGKDAEEYRHYEEALRYYRMAAEAGNNGGIASIATLYLHGMGVKKDYKKAMELYQKAADNGHAWGMTGLGEMYEGHYYGIKKDYNKSFELYKSGVKCNGHNSEAMYKLGCMYWLGYGVTKNAKKAIELFKLAANKGNVDAMMHLGGAYEDGIHVKKNLKQAKEWYKKAADRGDPDAIDYLEDM